MDSFLFSETYEKELLLLKLELEDAGVDEWLLLENAYSFQGAYTGLHAKALLDADPRFNRFRHKISIISKEEKTELIPKHQFMDHLSFKVEYWQRDLAYDYFMQHYGADDWVMISDVDEMIDFSDPGRRSELLEKMQQSPNGLVVFPTRRFWYDFDNAYHYLIGNAMCSKKYLADTGKQLHDVRAENRRVMYKGWKNTIAFEYSSCYSADFIIRKFYTSTHTGYTPNDLRKALRCNQRTPSENATWKTENNKYFFFETVPLTPRNSPAAVRNNLAYFKTNSVDPDYKRNRRADYPELFSAMYYIREYKGRWQRFYQKKMKGLKYKVGKLLGGEES
ncbi:MAG: hypothetical protein U0U33_14520 [Chitinophagaceae bacterium]